MVPLIIQLTATSTKATWFSVLATWLTDWWSLNFYISETRLYILIKLLRILRPTGGWRLAMSYDQVGFKQRSYCWFSVVIVVWKVVHYTSNSAGLRTVYTASSGAGALFSTSHATVPTNFDNLWTYPCLLWCVLRTYAAVYRTYIAFWELP